MDDITIRVLLSRFIKQAILDARTETIDDDQFAEAVASAAWNSLIYLLRQSVIQQDRVTLQEVGELVKESGSWKFHPAASIAESDAFRMPATEGRKQLARLALFHLEQGRDLARSIPKDVENPRAAETWKYSSVKMAEEPDATLAGELRKVAVEIFGLSRNLSTQESFDVELPPRAKGAGGGLFKPGRQPAPKRDMGYWLGASEAPAPKPMDQIDFKSAEVIEPATEILPIEDLIDFEE
jgi:hypothetical protein